jgi:hypothetical protein
MPKKKTKKEQKIETRDVSRPYPGPLFRNYDYTDDPSMNETSPGGGLYHGRMDKFKSVKEFREYKDKQTKKRKKKMLAVANWVALTKLAEGK